MSMLPGGVVDSIDLNQVNIGDCWLYSSADVWDTTYTRILSQPLSIEATDINDYRFKNSNTTITVRDGLGALAHVVWAGYCELVMEPGGSIAGETAASVSSVGIQMPSPLFQVDNSPITDSGVLVVSMPGTGTNVVLDDGTTTPLAGLGGNILYYNSLDQIQLSNSTSETSFAPGASSIIANTLVIGNSVKFEGNGQIKWNLINSVDTLTLKFKIGSTVLNTTVMKSDKLKPSIAINQLCNYTIDLQINCNSVLSTTASVSVTGTIELYDGYTSCVYTINESNTIDTTIDNTVDLTATWAVASIVNYISIDKLQIIPIYAVVPAFDVDSAGTVTSVAMSATGPLSVTGSPITSAGTLALTWAGLSTDLVLADGSTTLLSNLATTSSLSSYLLSSVALTTYLGITAQATDSNKLNGQLAAYYATATDLTSYLTTASAATTYLGIASQAADANKLNGQLASFYATASSLSSYLLSSTAATTYLGITSQASDSNKLNGQLASYYATVSSLSSYLLSSVAATTYQPLDSRLSDFVLLGNPATSGYILSCSTTGVLSWIAPGSTGSFLPLTAGSGSPLTDKLYGTGAVFADTTNSTISIATTYNNAYSQAINALNSLMPSGGQYTIDFGQDASTNNQANFGFKYDSTGSTNNRIVFGLYNNNAIMSLIGTGVVNIRDLGTGTVISTSGDLSTLTGTNLVLGNGTTIAQSTFLTTAPTITLTGDITGSGSGSFATTLAASIAGTHTFTDNIFSGGGVTYIPTAPLMLVNPAAGAMKTQLSLINTGGGAGAGAAIDFFTYDVSGGTNPGLRVCAIDNSYSADFAVYTKAPGAAGNSLVERFRITNSGVGTLPGGLTCNAGGIGYSTGAGGTVSQGTSKSTGVTLSKLCGTITMNAAALANAATVSFTLTNTFVANTDVVVVQHTSGGTLGAYNFAAAPASGSVVISVRNVHTASLSEAIVLRFIVIKAVTA